VAVDRISDEGDNAAEDLERGRPASGTIPPDQPGGEDYPSRTESRAGTRVANTAERTEQPADDDAVRDAPISTESAEEDLEQPETSSLEGKRDYVVDDPADPSRTITDIDRIEDGALWEEKSATSAVNIDKWVAKHIDKKFDSYLEARQHLPGYEEAPIGFKFTEPAADPEFRSAVEDAVDGLRKSHPDVTIRLEWS
jgi:hypothetical protein